MSDVSDISKVYLFLSQRNDWVSEADTNGDGTIIKYEFSKFMKGNYDFTDVSENDQNELINKFWAKFDTNRSGKVFNNSKLFNKNALDSNEIDALNKKVEVFKALNDYISKLTAPSCVDAAKWKSSVSESLSNYAEEFVNQGKSASDLTTYLESIIALVSNKTTANIYAQSVIDDANTKYGYNIKGDAQLQQIITNYVLSLKGEEDEENVGSIKSDINNIIETYLAKAGLCRTPNSPYDLESLGYDNSTLNDTQKEVIIETIKNNLPEEFLEKYNDYADNLNSAIEAFVDAKSKEKNVLFDVLNNESIATSFINSKFKTNLDNMISIDNGFMNVDEESDFYNILVQNFGESLANIIAQDSKYIDTYKKIIEDVKAQVVAGTLSMDDVQNYILEQISNNLADFFPNGYGDLSMEALNKLYEKLTKAADAENDSDKSLTMHREAAITYCDALVQKGDNYKKAVNEVFTTGDYETEINALLPSQIKAKIEKIKEKVGEIVVVSDMTEAEKNALIAGLKDSYTFEQGATDNKIQLPKIATCNGKTITTDRISYSSSGCVSVDKFGQVSIDTSKAGTYPGTISISIDNNIVATKNITVTIQENMCWGDLKDEYSGYISDGGSGTPKGTKSLGELYSNNGVINLLAHDGVTGAQNWKGSVATAKTTLASFVNETLLNAMKATGNYSETALNNAAQKVIALYNAAFDQSIDGSHWAGKKSTRDNQVSFDGKSYGYRVSKWYKDSTAMNTDYSRGCSANNNQLGLSINEGYDNHRFQITLNTRCVMDLFSKFYKQAIV